MSAYVPAFWRIVNENSLVRDGLRRNVQYRELILIPPSPGSNPGAPANDFKVLHFGRLQEQFCLAPIRRLQVPAFDPSIVSARTEPEPREYSRLAPTTARLSARQDSPYDSPAARQLRRNRNHLALSFITLQISLALFITKHSTKHIDGHQGDCGGGNAGCIGRAVGPPATRPNDFTGRSRRNARPASNSTDLPRLSRIDRIFQ